MKPVRRLKSQLLVRKSYKPTHIVPTVRLKPSNGRRITPRKEEEDRP